MNDKLREAAHALLQATEYMLEATKHLEPCPATVDEAEAATAALRAALMSVPDGAEQPAEPVAKLVPGTMKSSHEPQPTIPPGYKLVPVEPTEEMIDAAKNNGAEGSRKEISGDYKAMLNAAPEAPQPAKRESLTDFDIADRFYAIGGAGANSLRYFAAGVRYAEVAHGIGGEV